MIQALSDPCSDADVRELAALLVDAVDAGASVSFLDDLTIARAEEWWRGAISSMHRRAVLLVARDEHGIVGSVQLQPCWAPNQPHRADIAKLLVHRRARRQGVGTKLMHAIEERARDAGFTLLTLDTKKGDAAERLYRAAGWIEVGVIPKYAMNPDRTFCDTVLFYKLQPARPVTD